VNAPDGFELPDRYDIREVMVSSDAEVIYRGVDNKLLREVLLKRPGPGLAATLMETGDESRALREARALASIQHDGIVRLIDVLECPGGPILVMEPQPGETLSDRLDRDGRLTAEEVRTIGQRLADALEAVHASGAVHRGLSPANIILRPDGDPCLAGFLFAKFCRSSIGISSISYGGGKLEENPDEPPKVLPSHPAPEQLYGQAADARSDIFGLGCVLYRCLTGEDAFPSMLTAGWSPPKPPREIVPDAPRALSDAVLKCLSRSPLGRYPSASELSATLASLPAERAGFTLSKRTMISAAAGALALAVAGFMMTGDDSSETDSSRGAMVVPQDGRAGAARGTHALKYASSHALLIGIGDVYPKNGFQRLPNAVSDVDAIAAELPSLGFAPENTTVIKDGEATGLRIRQELGRLSEQLEPDDRLFVYYAGHGERHERAERSGWIVPADAKSFDDDISRATWLSFDAFVDVSKLTEAKHVLIAMDCCYAGRIAAMRGSSAQRYEERYLTQDAHFVLCSGRDEPVSDGTGDHSPFAAALLEAFSLDQLAITGSQLSIMVEQHLLEANAKQQAQFAPLSGKGDGEFVFFLNSDE